jgi:hypothetical protein
MAKAPVSPSTSAKAFDCPHCGAYADQAWLDGYGADTGFADRLPRFLTPAFKVAVEAKKDLSDTRRHRLLTFADIVLAGGVAVEHGTERHSVRLGGLNASVCLSCSKASLWVDGKLIWPSARIGVEPNPDLSADLTADFEEARSIVMTSPRGAAALMRLVVQKLCIELGGDGKSIDADIAALVAKGLSPMIQQALDVVRVVGNNAVHPGQIDLKDDPDTVVTLFGLVNIIAEQMITQPKQLQAVYNGLPAGALAAIQARNAKATGGAP